ncbi:MAG: hypothetical protein ABUT20_07670 [Bacteroidota bacterium]
MKTRSFTTMGALHPILFFIVVYVVALFFSIFICSSLFYSCQSSSKVAKEQKIPTEKESNAGAIATVVLR